VVDEEAVVKMSYDKNISKLCHDLSKVILKSKVTSALTIVGVLDMLKTDILMNSGMVKVNGKVLVCGCSECKK